MAQKLVELTKVVLYYTVVGKEVQARIRHYQDGKAVLEESVTLTDSQLQAMAVARQAPPTWTEEDVCAAVEDGVWRSSLEALAVIRDIAPDEVAQAMADADAEAAALPADGFGLPKVG